jgi:site-specific DNA-methyltransferase (adenine-specific)
MDCMEYMKGCEDNAFDLAIVDPPYGIGMAGGKIGGDNLAVNIDYKLFHGRDLDPPDSEYFAQLMRVSKNQIMWGANHYIANINTLLANSPCWIVWDKQNGEKNFADCELAWTSFKTAVRKFNFRWAGMLQGNMKNKEYRIHPTQKPVKLYDWLLSNYAKPGDRILDTHLGSGSSAIAAHYFGCDFVGMEIDKDYYDAAVKRFNAETAQLDIFG